jgi:Na+-transporting methylmalonyl-CoA/oxaloacetate decarboxylase gamma subunit
MPDTDDFPDTRETITDEELRSALKDNRETMAPKPFARWKTLVIVVGIVMLVLSIMASLLLGLAAWNQAKLNYAFQQTQQRTNNRHHKETAAQNAAIKAIISQHTTELQVVAGLPAADAVLFDEVVYLNASVAKVCASLHLDCGSPPSETLPSTTPTTAP